jgi:DNA-binding MarR family transcriptional regulator
MKHSDTFSFKIHALTYSIDLLANNVLKKNSDINFSQFLILLCYTENPGKTQKFASNWLQITEATVSYMIKRMVSRGYLQIENDTTDGRIKHINPTLNCVKLIQYIYPLLEAALALHLANLANNQVNEMMKNADKITQSIMQEQININKGNY